MALSNVELYEALRGHVGEDAARMIADVIPPSRNLATKLDLEQARGELRAEIAGVRTEVAELRGEMREGFAMLRGEIKASSRDTMRWMLAFFIPVWAGTWGTMLAILFRS